MNTKVEGIIAAIFSLFSIKYFPGGSIVPPSSLHILVLLGRKYLHQYLISVSSMRTLTHKPQAETLLVYPLRPTH